MEIKESNKILPCDCEEYTSEAYLKPFRHLRWSVLRNELTAESCQIVSQNAPFYMLESVLNAPLNGTSQRLLLLVKYLRIWLCLSLRWPLFR